MKAQVMASEVHLVVNGPIELTAAAMDCLDELERSWSRFIPDSEISRLNASPGRPVEVGADTILLLEKMVEGWQMSNGHFNPTILPALIDEGYPTSIDDPDRRTILPGSTTRTGRADQILIDRPGGIAWLPAGTGIDPGGIGKGLAADIVANELVVAGAEGVMVNIGGDLRVVGRPGHGEWTVAVEDPLQANTAMLTFAINQGGVATSSTLSRTWGSGNQERHHLIDPALGRSADTDLTAVTVIAPTAWQAEVEATTTLLLGRVGGLAWLVDRGLDGMLIGAGGQVAVTPGLEAHEPTPA